MHHSIQHLIILTELSQGSIGGNEGDHGGGGESPPPSPGLHPAPTRFHPASGAPHQFYSNHRSAFVPVAGMDSRLVD